jgi:hypothetical protein
MNPVKSLVFVAGTALLFAIIGAVTGLLLGSYMPDYYIGVFELHGESPVQVGFGLGLTQGMILGSVVGVVILGISAWSKRGK